MVNTKKFSEFSNGGDLSNDNITVGLGSGTNTYFNNPWTFLPDGTTGDRPVPASSMYYRLRFNTTLEVYEYYDPTTLTWTQLSGTGTGTVNPGVTNDIAFYAANGQAVSPISGNSNAVLVTNSSKVPSLSSTLPTGLSIPGATITSSTATLLSGSVVAAPVSGTDLVNKTYVDNKFTSGVTSITGTTNQVIASASTGAVTLSLPQNISTGSTPTFGGLTLSSIPLGSSSGGTGVNNGSSTITLGGNLTTSGAFASTFTMTGATNVTFPTSGTLLTSASAVTSITGTANQISASASVGSVTLSIPNNPILPGLGGVTLPTGNTAQRAGTSGTIRFNSQTSVFEGTVDGAAWSAFSTAAGTVVSVTGTTNRITSTGGTTPVIDISASYVGQSSITTLGTISTGVWNGTTIAVANGGTGITSFGTGVATALGQNVSGSGGIALTTSPSFTTPTLGAATATSITFSPTTNGIVGTTTNDNASAGYVGQIIESTVLVGSAVAATSTVNLDVTSISLTAGDWDVWGVIFLNPNAATTTTAELAWINTTSATQATWPNGGGSSTCRVSLGAGINMSVSVGPKRISLSGTTTVYLSANITFAVNTMSVYGYIGARRVR